MTTTTTRFTGTLVDGARSGDTEAWNRIVTEIGPKIRGYARARGVADPEDLTQDVFVAAAARIGDFDGGDEAFRSWLFGIAYRQIVNRYRAAAKQTAPLPETLPDTGGSPEDQVVGRFEATEAVAALDVLGDVERDVVLMRVVGGLDTADVATAVGKRPGNVRVIQSRAMEKLRKELERRGYGAAGVWAAALVADVVSPIGVADASVVAGAAASSAGAGVAGAGAATVGTVAGVSTVSTVAKAATAVVLAVAVAGGTAAVTGNLPEPAQRWIADVVDRVGVSLPGPADTTLPIVEADPVIPRFPTSLLPGPTTTVPSLPTTVDGGGLDATDSALLDDGTLPYEDQPTVDTTLPLP